MMERSIENYKILEKLNDDDKIGVYKAVDLPLDRLVLVKIAASDAENNSAADDLRAEAAVLTRFTHSCVPTLHALVKDADRLYIVTEFVEGETLDRVLVRENRLAPDRAAAIFAPIFDCFEAAHKTGVAHGNFMASSVVLTDDGKVKILGFGAVPAANAKADAGGKHADLAALGAILRETLTGKSALDSDKVKNQPISSAVAAVIERAQLSSADSFRDAAEFGAALSAAGFNLSGASAANGVQENAPPINAGANFAAGKERAASRFYQRRLKTFKEIKYGASSDGTNKKAQKHFKMAGAAICAVLVLHVLWQFSFIQSENRRTAEASLDAVPPIESPLEKFSAAAPVNSAAAPDYAAQPKELMSAAAKTTRTAAYRQTDDDRANALPSAPKKKAVAETRAERLRRAEKLLTGF